MIGPAYELHAEGKIERLEEMGTFREHDRLLIKDPEGDIVRDVGDEDGKTFSLKLQIPAQGECLGVYDYIGKEFERRMAKKEVMQPMYGDDVETGWGLDLG